MVKQANVVEVLYKKSFTSFNCGDLANASPNKKHKKKTPKPSSDNIRFKSRKPPKNPRNISVRQEPKLTVIYPAEPKHLCSRKNSSPTKEKDITSFPKVLLPKVKSDRNINNQKLRFLSRSKFVLRSRQAGSNSSLVVNLSQSRCTEAALRNDRLIQFFLKSGDARQNYNGCWTINQNQFNYVRNRKRNRDQHQRIVRSKSMDMNWKESSSSFNASRRKSNENRENHNTSESSGSKVTNSEALSDKNDKVKKSEFYYGIPKAFGNRNIDYFGQVLGPTPDETILAGLQTVIEMCSVAETSLSTRQPTSVPNFFSTNKDVIDWVESEYSSLENHQKSANTASADNLKERRRTLQDIEKLVKLKSDLDRTVQNKKRDSKVKSHPGSKSSTNYSRSSESVKNIDVEKSSLAEKILFLPSTSTFGQNFSSRNSLSRSTNEKATESEEYLIKTAMVTSSEPISAESKSTQADESLRQLTDTMHTTVEDYTSSKSTKNFRTSSKSVQASIKAPIPESPAHNHEKPTGKNKSPLVPIVKKISASTSSTSKSSGESVKSIQTYNKSLQASLIPQLSHMSVQTSSKPTATIEKSAQTALVLEKCLPAKRKAKKAPKSVETQSDTASLDLSCNCNYDVFQPNVFNIGSTNETLFYKSPSYKGFHDGQYQLEAIQEEVSSTISSSTPLQQLNQDTSLSNSAEGMCSNKTPVTQSETFKSNETDLESYNYNQSKTNDNDKDLQHAGGRNLTYPVLNFTDASNQGVQETVVPSTVNYPNMNYIQPGSNLAQQNIQLPEQQETAIKSAMRFPHQMSSLYEQETSFLEYDMFQKSVQSVNGMPGTHSKEKSFVQLATLDPNIQICCAEELSPRKCLIKQYRPNDDTNFKNDSYSKNSPLTSTPLKAKSGGEHCLKIQQEATYFIDRTYMPAAGQLCHVQYSGRDCDKEHPLRPPIKGSKNVYEISSAQPSFNSEETYSEEPSYPASTRSTHPNSEKHKIYQDNTYRQHNPVQYPRPTDYLEQDYLLEDHYSNFKSSPNHNSKGKLIWKDPQNTLENSPTNYSISGKEGRLEPRRPKSILNQVSFSDKRHLNSLESENCRESKRPDSATRNEPFSEERYLRKQGNERYEPKCLQTGKRTMFSPDDQHFKKLESSRYYESRLPESRTHYESSLEDAHLNRLESDIYHEAMSKEHRLRMLENEKHFGSKRLFSRSNHVPLIHVHRSQTQLNCDSNDDPERPNYNLSHAPFLEDHQLNIPKSESHNDAKQSGLSPSNVPFLENNYVTRSASEEYYEPERRESDATHVLLSNNHAQKELDSAVYDVQDQPHLSASNKPVLESDYDVEILGSENYREPKQPNLSTSHVPFSENNSRKLYNGSEETRLSPRRSSLLDEHHIKQSEAEEYHERKGSDASKSREPFSEVHHLSKLESEPKQPNLSTSHVPFSENSSRKLYNGSEETRLSPRRSSLLDERHIKQSETKEYRERKGSDASRSREPFSEVHHLSKLESEPKQPDLSTGHVPFSENSSRKLYNGSEETRLSPRRLFLLDEHHIKQSETEEYHERKGSDASRSRGPFSDVHHLSKLESEPKQPNLSTSHVPFSENSSRKLYNGSEETRLSPRRLSLLDEHHIKQSETEEYHERKGSDASRNCEPLSEVHHLSKLKSDQFHEPREPDLSANNVTSLNGQSKRTYTNSSHHSTTEDHARTLKNEGYNKPERANASYMPSLQDTHYTQLDEPISSLNNLPNSDISPSRRMVIARNPEKNISRSVMPLDDIEPSSSKLTSKFTPFETTEQHETLNELSAGQDTIPFDDLEERDNIDRAHSRSRTMSQNFAMGNKRVLSSKRSLVPNSDTEPSAESKQDVSYYDSAPEKEPFREEHTKLQPRISRSKSSNRAFNNEQAREESRRFHRNSSKLPILQTIPEQSFSRSKGDELAILEPFPDGSEMNPSQHDAPPAEPCEMAGHCRNYINFNFDSYNRNALDGATDEDKDSRKSPLKVTRHPNKCNCGNPNCECFKSIQPRDIRYASVRITKFDFYSTFEILRSTKKKPRCMPSAIESIFVVKNK